ncbi:hypothetical protein MCT05_04300 [Vibrio aestuarianus]|nr:hypothetical protein [Vibrio aestuarianus]
MKNGNNIDQEFIAKNAWMIDLRLEGEERGYTERQIANIRNAIFQWVTDGNPDAIDEAVRYCWDEQLENNMPPILIYFVVDAATKRLNRDKKVCNQYRKKNKEKQKAANENALIVMFHLKEFCGISKLDDLAEMGAKARYHAYPHLDIRRPSTLREDYGKWEKSSSDYIEVQRKKHPNGWPQEQIDSYIESLNRIELPQYIKDLPLR